MVNLDKKSEGRSRVDRDADNLQLQQLEEKDVVSSVATVLSDLCGPGEWMPMEKLHAESHCSIGFAQNPLPPEHSATLPPSINPLIIFFVSLPECFKLNPVRCFASLCDLETALSWLAVHSIKMRCKLEVDHCENSKVDSTEGKSSFEPLLWLRLLVIPENAENLRAKRGKQLLEQYSSVWHHSRVRRYLTSEDWPGPESKGKPWYGLLMLLRKYPEHFVINTRSKGRVTLEFVSLVSLLS
ncbi:FHA domain-containing protein [Vigna angularis]|uniref:FHA domain-containing protein n=1 Tax=Phaseolus angularis TaxID=3914 RepID=A0A8T0KZE9_PHAAN|nr:FHA domain-containing protein [Vigna angularis]